ncbi:MAG: glycosyltransferase family 4 protein [Candidatus Nanopelagicales bacterium]|nr:glycosyltransferase family 4 protein [Candidatus Nanopelagicales bacterium]
MNKTLVITNDFPPRAGGIQAFVHGVLLNQPPDSVVVYAPSWKRSAQFDAEQPFPVVRHRTSLMLPEPLVLNRARQIAAEHGCDRVLFGAAAPLGLLAPRLRSREMGPIVAMTHGHEAAWATTPGAKSVMRSIGDSVDTITYLGEYTRSRIASALRPEAAARMRRLVPGVDADTFHPRVREQGLAVRSEFGLADRPVIVCVSRLMPRKGQDTLIRALPLIQKKVPDAALLIVWEALPRHYAAGDVFAMPCRTRNRGWDVEGLGIVYLEAGAIGLPVIAGDSGGAPDAVLDGETGFVVDGRSLHDVAGRVVDLLDDAELARTMGARGRAWVEQQWTWPIVSGRLTDLLDGIDPDVGRGAGTFD